MLSPIIRALSVNLRLSAMSMLHPWQMLVEWSRPGRRCEGAKTTAGRCPAFSWRHNLHLDAFPTSPSRVKWSARRTPKIHDRLPSQLQNSPYLSIPTQSFRSPSRTSCPNASSPQLLSFTSSTLISTSDRNLFPSRHTNLAVSDMPAHSTRLGELTVRQTMLEARLEQANILKKVRSEPRLFLFHT
jgi:hypothetical protein